MRPGQYLAPPWQFGSTRHPVPRHVAGTTIPNTSATETNGPRPALQTKFTTPHRARQLAGHHRWDVDDPKKPPLQKLWTPPTRGCAPVQGTGTSLVTGGTHASVVLRFDKTLRATPRGRPHGLKHICHKRVELRGTLQHVDLQSTIRGGTPHPRGISVRQAAPCHTTWQTPRSPTHLPQDRWAKTRSADRTTTSPGPAHTFTHTAKLAV